MAVVLVLGLSLTACSTTTPPSGTSTDTGKTEGSTGTAPDSGTVSTDKAAEATTTAPATGTETKTGEATK